MNFQPSLQRANRTLQTEITALHFKHSVESQYGKLKKRKKCHTNQRDLYSVEYKSSYFIANCPNSFFLFFNPYFYDVLWGHFCPFLSPHPL